MTFSLSFWEGFIAGFATAGLLAVWVVGWREIGLSARYKRLQIPGKRIRRSQAYRPKGKAWPLQ